MRRTEYIHTLRLDTVIIPLAPDATVLRPHSPEPRPSRASTFVRPWLPLSHHCYLLDLHPVQHAAQTDTAWHHKFAMIPALVLPGNLAPGGETPQAPPRGLILPSAPFSRAAGAAASPTQLLRQSSAVCVPTSHRGRPLKTDSLNCFETPHLRCERHRGPWALGGSSEGAREWPALLCLGSLFSATGDWRC